MLAAIASYFYFGWFVVGGFVLISFGCHVLQKAMRGLLFEDFRKFLEVDPLKAAGLSGKERRRIRRKLLKSPKYKEYAREILS